MENKKLYEKLGLLYLGRELDADTEEALTGPLLFKNKNLTTHGAIIGMTGSGKTGLGIGLIEEAIMDNIPSIIIDPKGDMGNLLLSFPDCAPENFLPWLDPAEAARNEFSLEEYAQRTAQIWKRGLEDWGQDLGRIRALRAKTQMCIYTPGSNAGRTVSVLSSFKAPAQELLADIDTLNGLVSTTANSLLALVDIKGDPLKSREHILVSSLFLHFWRSGRDLNLESLIGGIVEPPFARVGVFPLETFYPQSERMGLAMALNNILASPTFAAWTSGEPLDIQRILYTEEGTPRTSIFSISHLSETERMFFVTMILNQFIGWMRRQPGSSSLKALLYMDEIFGYFPPTANPPSKKPMMMLLKQARAYGVGVLLATQNPVDLDYKGLSNIGTWFVGRLQTKQDRERLLDGIVGASEGKLDTEKVGKMLARMKGRQFILNSVHIEEPLLFETRWVMSYLKGPLSKNDIKRLMDSGLVGTVPEVKRSLPDPLRESAENNISGQSPAPVLAQKIIQLYSLQNTIQEEFCFEPWLHGVASVRYYNVKRNIDIVDEVKLRIFLEEPFLRADWSLAEPAGSQVEASQIDPPEGASYGSLPQRFQELKDMRAIKKEFSDFLYQNKRLELLRSSSAGLESEPGEQLGDFKVRLGDHLRNLKEMAVETLEGRYRSKQRGLEDKLDRALDKLDKEKQDVAVQTKDSLISFGVAVVGAFLGRKTFSATNVNRAARGLRSVGRVAKEKGEVQRAEEEVVEVRASLEELAREVEEKVNEVDAMYDPENYGIEAFSIKPRRADIFEVQVALVWEMVA